ncbi:hypothetical protein ACFLT4_03585 [Chloroflexota bacterium]
MKKRLWLTASVLVVALLVGGCGNPRGVKPLTDKEKDRFIEIVLNTPEALRYLGSESKYEIEVKWVALGWKDSKATEWHPLDYEEIAGGNLPSDRLYLSESVTIHPQVYIRVGDPVRMFISVAFDRETQEVVHVELLPGRPTAGPTPAEESHPEGMESLRWLTEAEKAKVIEIALNETKAAKYLKEYSQYSTSLRWTAIVWENSGYSEWRGIRYEWKTDENFKYVPESAVYYSRVVVNFGEPPQWQVMAAINPDTGKVALVEENPFRTGPTPPK